MAGTLALTRVEFKRLMRNRRYFIFTVGFPVILYLLIGNRVSTPAYYLGRPAALWLAALTARSTTPTAPDARCPVRGPSSDRR